MKIFELLPSSSIILLKILHNYNIQYKRSCTTLYSLSNSTLINNCDHNSPSSLGAANTQHHRLRNSTANLDQLPLTHQVFSLPWVLMAGG